MRHFKSKPFHATWILAILLAGIAIYYIEVRISPPPILEIPNIGHVLQPTPSQTPKSSPTPSNSQTKNQLPLTYLLEVPFTPQAPTANWDELHNEACEEASVIMVNEYFAGNKTALLPSDLVETQLAKITEWEKQAFGYFLDIDAPETARLLNEMYGLKTKLIKNMTEEEIKTELLEGKLVIWSANGQKLNNPNFRQPGPPYHMLVIIGWNKNGFVTNDPGTRKGHNYPYTYETLYNAAGAWSHNLNAVDEGDKTAIVVWK